LLLGVRVVRSRAVLHQVVRDHFETFCAAAEATRDGQGLPRGASDRSRLSARAGAAVGLEFAAAVAVFVRAILAWLRRRAHRAGVADGRGGGVAIVQRFGAALNLNVHIHALIIDGVFVADGAGGVRFCPAAPVGEDELAVLLGVIERRLVTMLARRGITDGRDGVDVPDPWRDETPALAGLAAASVRGVRALGPRAGRAVRRWGDAIDLPEPPAFGRWHVRQGGFDLHAGIVVPAGARERLERLCRYALRPPLGQDRLQIMPEGSVVLELRRRWTDGTTHLIFEPVELLERLAALNAIARRLNRRPRKTLGYQTPADRLATIVASTG